MISIKNLQEMNKIDFARTIRNMRKSEIQTILNKYKLNINKNLKVEELLEILFKCVNGEIDPTNDFQNVYNRINNELNDFYFKYNYPKTLEKILECETTRSLKKIESRVKEDFNKINLETIPKFRSKKKGAKLKNSIDELNNYVQDYIYPEIEKQKFQLHMMKRRSGELRFDRFDEDLIKEIQQSQK